MEAAEADTIELTCSSEKKINTCTFTNPGDTLLDARAQGAAYEDGRVEVLGERQKSCGLKITTVGQEDFGPWRSGVMHVICHHRQNRKSSLIKMKKKSYKKSICI